MDILIYEGDLAFDRKGNAVAIYSEEEACQRVKLVLSTKKGSFWFNRQFGFDYDSLLSAKSSQRTMLAQILCREALADQKEIEVVNADVTVSIGYVRLGVEIKYKNVNKYVEVYYYDDI
ncbi:MAG: hypothetical protein II685_07765 [Clostridia bacterium]|nr:hypothetical protein [Clostridia bacterium]